MRKWCHIKKVSRLSANFLRIKVEGERKEKDSRCFEERGSWKGKKKVGENSPKMGDQKKVLRGHPQMTKRHVFKKNMPTRRESAGLQRVFLKGRRANASAPTWAKKGCRQ